MEDKSMSVRGPELHDSSAQQGRSVTLRGQGGQRRREKEAIASKAQRYVAGVNPLRRTTSSRSRPA